MDSIYDCEPDAGLGNGGLGRLAACYLDGLATQGYVAKGYTILYEYGIFKQKLVDGWQTELPDFWLPGGEVWLKRREKDICRVNFGGEVVDRWDEHYHSVELRNADEIIVSSSCAFCISAYELDGRPVGGKAPELLRALKDAAVNDFKTATARTMPIAK